MAEMHSPDSPLNSGPGLMLGVLLAKYFWKIQVPESCPLPASFPERRPVA